MYTKDYILDYKSVLLMFVNKTNNSLYASQRV